MIIALHEVSAGQSRRCIESLLDEAKALARTPRMQATKSLGEVVHWIRAQPYLREDDQDPVVGLGHQDHCRPHQRIRFWPRDGLNCWEASVHYAAAVLVHGLPKGYRLHLWDVRADKDEIIGQGVVLHAGARHAFPRLEGPDGKQQLVNLQSQHQAASPPLRPAAANDIWSDIALGVGIATPVLAMVAGVEGGPVAGQAVGALGKLGEDELRSQSSDGKPAKPAAKPVDKAGPGSGRDKHRDADDEDPPRRRSTEDPPRRRSTNEDGDPPRRRSTDENAADEDPPRRKRHRRHRRKDDES